MVSFPWAAYGVSQAFYYRKAMAENTSGGVKYESVILEAQNKFSSLNNNTFEENIGVPYGEEINNSQI